METMVRSRLRYEFGGKRTAEEWGSSKKERNIWVSLYNKIKKDKYI